MPQAHHPKHATVGHQESAMYCRIGLKIEPSNSTTVHSACNFNNPEPYKSSPGLVNVNHTQSHRDKSVTKGSWVDDQSIQYARTIQNPLKPDYEHLIGTINACARQEVNYENCGLFG